MNTALLKYLALSTGVHADALEYHVAENRRVLHQIASDARRLAALEEQLAGAVVAAGRIGTVGGVLLAARSARGAATGATTVSSSTLVQGARRAQSSATAPAAAPPAAGTARVAPQSPATASPPAIHSAGDALRLAAMAVDFSDDATAPVKLAPDQAIANAEAAVARLQHAMVVAERQSVEAKLRRLEALKAAAAARRPSRADLLQASAGFRFSLDVEALWTSGKVGASPTSSSSSSANTNTTKKGEATTIRETEEDGDDDDDAASSSPPTFFASVLHGAVQRFKARYSEALHMLRLMDSDPAIEAMAVAPLAASAERLDLPAVQRVCSAVVYAQALSSPAHNSDLRLVLELEQADGQTLSQHFERLCETHWTRGPDPLWAAGGGSSGGVGSSGPSASASSSCIGLSPSYFLPRDWECARALQASLHRETLPPARHVLCDRFSFADHQELLSLEILRVEVQARIMHSVLFSGGDSHPGASSSSSSAGKLWVRDVASARAALVLQECATSAVARSSSVSMPVLARVADGDGEEDDD